MSRGKEASAKTPCHDPQGRSVGRRVTPLELELDAEEHGRSAAVEREMAGILQLIRDDVGLESGIARPDRDIGLRPI